MSNRQRFPRRLPRVRRHLIVLSVVAAVAVTACSGAAAQPGQLSGGAVNSITAAAPRVMAAVARLAPAAAPAPNRTLVGSQPSVAATDWPVYHRNALRTGYDPTFPAPGKLSKAWSTRLDGAVYGQPIVVGGIIFAATENDSVYALKSDGSVKWKQHLGTPVALSTLPCGDIDPLGITSTPAYDPKTGSVFVSAELKGPGHRLFALNPATGAVKWSRTLDLTGYDPTPLQQRGALAIGNGYVYVGFGGLAGDCGQYVGKVVAVPTNNVGPRRYYRVPAQREAGI